MSTKTPWGSPIQTYSSKADFYKARPELADGWDPSAHPGKAPLGADVYPGGNDRQWLVVFCAPRDSLGGFTIDEGATGTPVVFDKKTHELHILDESPVTWADAQARYSHKP